MPCSSVVRPVPSVTTLQGIATNADSATLNSLVNPNNGVTTVYYRWGLTTNYTAVTPSLSLTEELNTAQDVAIFLGDLAPSTTYHYQAVAANSACAGGSPFVTISENSRAFKPCGSTAASVPKKRISVLVALNGAMNRYPRRGSVSMKRGLAAESPKAVRNLRIAVFRPSSNPT